MNETTSRNILLNFLRKDNENDNNRVPIERAQDKLRRI